MQAPKESPHPELVLASTSPYRKQILENLQLKFRCFNPHFEEIHDNTERPEKLAIVLARGKAMSIAQNFRNAIVIGSDQIVWYEGEVLCKPGSQQRAFEELKRLRGHVHQFFMGLFLYHTELEESQEFVVTGAAKLRRDLTDKELMQYVKRDNPIDCAGSAKTKGCGLMLFERLDCEDWTAIVGLPVIALTTGLRKWKYPLF